MAPLLVSTRARWRDSGGSAAAARWRTVMFSSPRATRGTDFFVIESGSVAIVQGHGRENRVIAVFGRHQFLGELSMLTGQRLYLSGVVSDGGEVIGDTGVVGLQSVYDLAD